MDIDTDLLLKESLEVHNIFLAETINSRELNIQQLKDDLSKKYPNVGKYDSIMTIVLSNNYDYNRLKYMLEMTSKIKKNEISEREASIQVGQVLVDEIVKPSLEKNTKK